MNFNRSIFFAFIVIFIFCKAKAEVNNQHGQKADSTWNEWNFRISPYFWYIGLEGTIYRPPQPTQLPIPPPPRYEIDISFQDIRHSIKFALMLAGQYKNEHIVAQFNFSSLILESKAITPKELILQDNILNLTYVAGDLNAGYRVVKKPKFEFDALIGMKFVYFSIGLKTNLAGVVPIEGERSKLWVDPAIGANLRYLPHRRIEIFGFADFGPPFPDNINSYQAMIGSSYIFTKTFLTTLGYRIYHIDFPEEETIFNGNVKGWIMRLGFQF
jgi:hypothetical protein